MLTKLQVAPFVLATLLGSFLLFQVQPVISKAVLPWFGGSPAVWTTCLLFFQLLLFAGYLYAHLLSTYLSRPGQGLVHAGLLMAAILALPIYPGEAWKPSAQQSPLPHLMALLCLHVGLPYFVLSSTGPLVQAWLARRGADARVYRLYAYSNVGSLGALLSYPLVFEPRLAVDHQATLWAVLFCLFAALQGWLAVGLARAGSAGAPQRAAMAAPAPRPSRRRQTAWVLLPALACIMLLAVTNHVCQDVAVIPFLWVLPLALYLLSFILCFDRPHWYRPRAFSIAALATLALVAGLSSPLLRGWLLVEVGAHLALLMVVCMLCHGEVARLKPSPRYLTRYYLMLSAGGALGGVLVAILCPRVFSSHLELPLAGGATMALAVALLAAYRRRAVAAGAGPVRESFDLRRVRRWRYGFAGLALVGAWLLSDSGPAGVEASSRNFFGVLRVLRLEQATGMLHGRTLHGLQWDAPRDRQPTAYYGRDSGVGRLIEAAGAGGPLRVGAVGLGCGTVAAYGRSGDSYDFFEINPEVERLARRHFTFLDDSPAEVAVHLGDGRLLLEQWRGAPFDLLILDAFSSDAVPAHLLTREAMQLYRQRLQQGGAIVVHVTNRHLHLAPVVHRLAADLGWRSGRLDSPTSAAEGTLAAQWVVVASPEADLWTAEDWAPLPQLSSEQLLPYPLWTDRNHDLLRILRFRSRTASVAPSDPRR